MNIKILSIGNSFSEDMQRYLHALAEANGDYVECHNLFIGGCSLERHFNNMKEDVKAYRHEKNGEYTDDEFFSIKDGLTLDKWDFVTLQQCSPSSPDYKTYEPYARELTDYVRKYAPEAKILVHQTWAYADTNVDKVGFDNHRDMFSHIERAYAKFSSEISADGVIKSGEVIERMMNEGIKAHRDGQHIGLGAGRYASALTAYCYLTGKRAKGTSAVVLDENVKEEIIEKIKECVDGALSGEGFYYPTKSRRNVPYAITYMGVADKNPERMLDMYLPEGEDFDVLVYFHGGGFVTGDKHGPLSDTVAKFYNDRGIAYVSANYRMYPSASFPDFIRDGALAVKFVNDYLQKLGNKGRIFIGGTSAGGYLTQLLCFDRKYLALNGMQNSDIAGYIHDAGQPTTHFNVLRERGMDERRLIIDEAAPLFYIGVEKEYPPMLFVLADSDMKNRAEQIELMLSTMRHFGYDMEKVEKVVIPNSTHSSYHRWIDEDGLPTFGKVVYDFIKRH